MIAKSNLFWLLLLCSFSLSAQKDTTGVIMIGDNSSEFVNYNGWAITYSPSALVNLFSAVQFGVERQIDINQYVELEAAYIPKLAGDSELYKTGYRIKLGYKKSWKKHKRRRNVFKNRLFTTTLYFRKSFHQHRENVIRQGDFIQEIEYSKTKTLIGPAFGFGTTKSLGDRLGLEASFLIGPGLYLVRVYDFPDDAERLTIPFFEGFSQERNYLYPIAGFTFKLKYRIGINS